MKPLKLPKMAKQQKVGKAPSVKEPEEIEICRPREEAVNPIAGREEPKTIEINGKKYLEVNLPDGSKTLILA